MAGVGVKLAAAGGLLGAVLVAQVHTGPAHTGIAPRALVTDVGFARVAHLSPDTAPFDAYLTPTGRGAPAVTLRGLAYGDVSAYQGLTPGGYTLTLRGTGTGEQGSVLLTQSVSIDPGQTYTLAVTGPRSQLSLRVIGDDIRPAPGGQARLRVINAATTLDPARVSVDQAGDLWPPVGVNTVSPYRDVPAGPHQLGATGPGGERPAATLRVSLAGNAVYTVLVLTGPDGPQLQLVTDAAAPAQVPRGPVETGGAGWAAGEWPPMPAEAPADGPPWAGVGPAALAGVPDPVAFDVPGTPVELAGHPAAGGRLQPVELRIPRIGVRTGVVVLRLDRSGVLPPPAGFSVAGWYGAVPGEPGPAVLAGHVDSWRGPAVFFRLTDLRRGDLVLVRRSDGRILRYAVTSVARYPKSRFPTSRVYGIRPDSELRLITCGGSFDPVRRSYLDNIVVSAVPASG